MAEPDLVTPELLRAWPWPDPSGSCRPPNLDELGRLLDRDVAPEQGDVVDAADGYSCCVTAQGMIVDRERLASAVVAELS